MLDAIRHACSRAKSPSDTRTSVRVMDKDWLEAQLAAGRSIESIAKEVGKHPSTVGYWVEEARLGVRARRQAAARGGVTRETRSSNSSSAGMTIRQIGGAARAELRGRAATGCASTGSRPSRTLLAARRARRRPRCSGSAAGTAGRSGSAPVLVAATAARACAAGRVAAYRRRVKEQLVEEAGGRCVLCGYDAVRRRASVPSPRPDGQGVRVCRAGTHPAAGEGARRGAEMRATVRKLPRGGRGGARAFGRPPADNPG